MLIKLNRWMNDFQQIKIVKPHNRWYGVIFLQYLSQFGKYPASAEHSEKIHVHCIFNQSSRQFPDTESEPLFESNGPKYAGWIFHKAQIVQNPNNFFFNVSAGREKIDEQAEFFRI